MLKSKRLFLISIFTILVSMTMLISATFAWFTSTVSTNANAVKSATYNITATITKEDSTSINPATENNVISVTFPSTGTYNVTVTPNGNANNGYCIVNFKNTNYYTENLTSGSFAFTVNATENEVLTITPNWGTYSSDIASILNDRNNTIGTASSFGGGQTQNTVDLLSGNDFNAKLIQNIGSATSLVFTDTNVPENVTTTDYSVNKSGSVLGWLDGNTYYISSLESGKKVIANQDASFMFNNLANLESITFGNSFNTQNVTNMNSMFYTSKNLTSLDLSSFNTTNVTNMNSMFYKCEALTSLTFDENFNTSNVQSMRGMFAYLNFASLDLSSFDMSSLTDMITMFGGSNNLIEVLVKDEATRNKLINGITNISDTKYIKVKTVTENSNSQENLNGSTAGEDNLSQNS